MQKHIKLLLVVAVFSFLAAGCNNGQTQNSQGVDDRGLEQQVQNPVATVTPTPTPTPTAVSSSKKSQIPSPTPSPALIEKVVDYVKYSGEDGKNALELLKAKYSGNVETKVYGGIGEYVKAINGTASDSKHFWEFFINGKSSNVGASSYVTKNGDLLEWKLSVIN